MFHIRTPDSSAANPISYCGELGVTDDDDNVTRFNLTDWTWVKDVAHGHPSICQACVEKCSPKQNSATAIDDGVQPF